MDLFNTIKSLRPILYWRGRPSDAFGDGIFRDYSGRGQHDTASSGTLGRTTCNLPGEQNVSGWIASTSDAYALLGSPIAGFNAAAGTILTFMLPKDFVTVATRGIFDTAPSTVGTMRLWTADSFATLNFEIGGEAGLHSDPVPPRVALNDGRYHMFATHWNGDASNNVYCSVDGIRTTGYTRAVTPATNNFAWGSINGVSVGSFCEFNSVVIFNRCLSENDMKRIYQAAFTPTLPTRIVVTPAASGGGGSGSATGSGAGRIQIVQRIGKARRFVASVPAAEEEEEALTYEEEVLADSPSFVIPMQSKVGDTAPNLIGDAMLFDTNDPASYPTHDQTGPGFVGGEKAYLWPNASAEYLVEPNAADTDFDLNMGDFTIEGWFKIAAGNNNNGTVKTICYRRVPAGGREDFILRFGDGAATNPHGYAHGSNLEANVETGSVWSHIAFVREGTLGRMYINGVVNSVTVNDCVNSGGAGGQFLMGTVPGAGTQRYKGLMCWVAGYKSALSAARILAHYEAGVV